MNHVMFHNFERTVSVFGKIVKVTLFEQKGDDVMSTNART